MNGKLLDDLPAGGIFYLLKEAQALIELWRRLYYTVRPNSLPGYRPRRLVDDLLRPFQTARQANYFVDKEHLGLAAPGSFTHGIDRWSIFVSG